MGQEWGADPDKLDEIAGQMRTAAGQLEGLRSGINARLHSVEWHGHDADHIRQQWNSHWSLAIGAAVHELSERSGALLNQARQQRVASGEHPSAAETRRWSAPPSHVPAPMHSKVSLLRHGLNALHDAEKDSKRLARTVAHDAQSMASVEAAGAVALATGAGGLAKEAWQDEVAGLDEVTRSRAFQDVVSGSHLVAEALADVAPIVALVPGAQGVAAGMLVVATAAQAVYVGGTALEMATGAEPWDPEELARGGLELVVDGVGASEARLAAEASTSVGTGNVLTRTLAQSTVDSDAKVRVLMDAHPNMAYGDAKSLVMLLHNAPTAVSAGLIAPDLMEHKYADAFNDAFGAGTGAAGLHGDAAAPSTPAGVKDLAAPIVSTETTIWDTARDMAGDDT